MPSFQCPVCKKEMVQLNSTNWRCKEHGTYNTPYLIGRIHAKHEGPFYITLTTEQIDQLVDVSEIGIAYDIVTMAEKQGYILPIDRGDNNL